MNGEGSSILHAVDGAEDAFLLEKGEEGLHALSDSGVASQTGTDRSTTTSTTSSSNSTSTSSTTTSALFRRFRFRRFGVSGVSVEGAQTAAAGQRIGQTTRKHVLVVTLHLFSSFAPALAFCFFAFFSSPPHTQTHKHSPKKPLSVFLKKKYKKKKKKKKKKKLTQTTLKSLMVWIFLE